MAYLVVFDTAHLLPFQARAWRPVLCIRALWTLNYLSIPSLFGSYRLLLGGQRWKLRHRAHRPPSTVPLMNLWMESRANITREIFTIPHAYIVIVWAPSSEFVSSSIPSWQILTAHAQPFRGARDLAFYLKVPLDSLPVWASSGGSGETARMRRAWTFAARIGDKYQIRLTLPVCSIMCFNISLTKIDVGLRRKDRFGVGGLKA